MWLMSWNSTSIMYAQYQVHLKITHSPSLKHFSPIAISICWASSVHETGKILRTGGRTVSYVALVVTFGILQFLREVTEVLPCLFLPEHDALEQLQEVEVQEQVLDTCRVIMVHVLNFRGASMCVESTLCGVHTVDLPCICKLN